MRATIKWIAATAVSFAPTAAFSQTPYWDWPGPAHMWGGWGFWWLFPLLMMIFMVVVCAFFVSRMFGHSRGGDTTSSALRVLSERFAKGEISKDEFEEKRSILGAGS
jgi:putative membrane protein